LLKLPAIVATGLAGLPGLPRRGPGATRPNRSARDAEEASRSTWERSDHAERHPYQDLVRERRGSPSAPPTRGAAIRS
jgi:hypothetical protein